MKRRMIWIFLAGALVGIVLSGLLTGILASRVVSGVVGELFGWREMYFAAAGLMVVSAAVVLYVLPDARSNFRGTYGRSPSASTNFTAIALRCRT